jgi:hypothetical protein
MQRVWHTSALQTAVHLLPMAIGGILVNVSVSSTYKKNNNLKHVLGCGWSDPSSSIQ